MEFGERFNLVEKPRKWLNSMAVAHHYMHRPISARAIPFGWGVAFDGEIHPPVNNATIGNHRAPVGFITFSTLPYTKLAGEFGYDGLPTKWQVLQLARLWINPLFQQGGAFYAPEYVPGFVDRKGQFRSMLATKIIDSALNLIQRRWLDVHPPRRMDQPYHIVKIVSYADSTHGHEGAIYKAAWFRRYGTTESMPRHDGSGSTAQVGHTLICYIKDLPVPTWEYQSPQLTLWAAS